MFYEDLIRGSTRCLVFLVLLLCTSSGWAGDPNNITSLVPGNPYPFSFEGHDVVVQLPVDYNDLNPIFFYYHGAGGRANVHYLTLMTESKGFILVGMTYTFGANGTIPMKQYTNRLKGEIKRLGKLKRHLEKELKLKIDNRRMYVGGISKGGWYSYDLFELKPAAWAGAMVIAAGRSQTTEILADQKSEPVSNKFGFKGKPVYIGVGETDVNRPAAERANYFLRSLGVDVTYEIYEGLGHAVDYESQRVRRWLKERLQPKGTQAN